MASAILNVAQTLATELSTSPLCYAGDPPEWIELSEVGISSYLEDLQRKEREGVSTFWGFANKPDWSECDAYFVVNNSEVTRIGTIEKLRCGYEIDLPLDKLINLMARVCSGFGAFQGFYWKYCVLTRNEKDENIFYIYEDDGTDVIVDWGIHQLPQLLFDDEFDFRRIPDSISWINYWDSVMVDTVGRDKILKQPWAHIAEQPFGGLILVMTEEPPNSQNSAQIELLRKIIENLSLVELQHKYRFKSK